MGSPWAPAQLFPGPGDEASSSASPWMKAEKCHGVPDKGALHYGKAPPCTFVPALALVLSCSSLTNSSCS